MAPSSKLFRCVALVFWLLVSIVIAQDAAGSATVHAADGRASDETALPVAATTELPACTSETQSKMTQFSLRNIELQRRCFDQSGGVNAFPFDAAPSRSQLVRLSTSAACLLVSKAVLRVIERECVLGEMMPVRATAETILKLNEDRKTLTKSPTPPEEELQRQIQERANMNRARDDDPISFSADQYPAEMQQYETQLTKAYATGGIILLSSDLELLNAISTTEQTGSEAAFAAVAELGESSLPPGHSSSSSSSTTSEEDFVTGSQQDENSHPENHGSLRADSAGSLLIDSGSSTDEFSKAPTASIPTSSSYRTHPSWLTTTTVWLCAVRVALVEWCDGDVSINIDQ